MIERNNDGLKTMDNARVVESGGKDWLHRLRQHLIGSNHSNAPKSQPHHANLKRASVLVLLDSEANILLNQRSLDLKSHPGEICFPGGKQDPEDDGDDVVTALRECNEEVGLQFQNLRATAKDEDESSSLPQVEILGIMPTIESLHHLCVTPVVAIVEDRHHSDLPLTLNEKEVAVAFWAPLNFFVRNTPIEMYPLEWSGETFWYRNYTYSNTISNAAVGTNRNKRPRRAQAVNITGLTAHVLYEVAKLAFPSNSSSFVLLRQFQRRKSKYWIPKCFDFAVPMLHQYDHEFHRHRKQNAANKKNRLMLDASCQMTDYNEDPDHPFAFQLIALNGKIIWTLSATTQEDKGAFRKAFMQFTNPSGEFDTTQQKK